MADTDAFGEAGGAGGEIDCSDCVDGGLAV
jgi:hypothetical protein